MVRAALKDPYAAFATFYLSPPRAAVSPGQLCGAYRVAIVREALSPARQRYMLGLSAVVEVTHREVAVTAEISEARLQYGIGGLEAGAL